MSSGSTGDTTAIDASAAQPPSKHARTGSMAPRLYLDRQSLCATNPHALRDCQCSGEHPQQQRTHRHTRPPGGTAPGTSCAQKSQRVGAVKLDTLKRCVCTSVGDSTPPGDSRPSSGARRCERATTKLLRTFRRVAGRDRRAAGADDRGLGRAARAARALGSAGLARMRISRTESTNERTSAARAAAAVSSGKRARVREQCDNALKTCR